MVPLMSRIAWELANKVANIVNVKTILREPPAVAKKKIMDSKDLLESWSKVSSCFPPMYIFEIYHPTSFLDLLPSPRAHRTIWT